MESSDHPEPIEHVEAAEHSKIAASESDCTVSLLDESCEPGQGRKLRIALFVLNVALYTFGLALVTGVVGYGVPIDAGPVVKTTMGALQMWHLSPLLLAVPLAAWGPWPAWKRGVLYLGVVIAASVVGLILERSLGPTGMSGGLRSAEFTTSWLVTTVPAIFLLALVGSFLRLRIGPRELPPVRLTIVSMMMATAVLGALVTVATASRQEVRNQRTRTYQATPSSSQRLEILVQAAVAGPLVAVVLGCVVASSFYWWARLLVLVIVAVYFGFMFYAVFRSAPQFPGVPYSLVWIYAGFLIGIALTAIWMVVNIRWLERSGWPCSRRNLVTRQS